MIERRWKPAKIKNRAGEDFATVGARVWRTMTAPTSTGQRYDYRGACQESAAEFLVGKQNMILEFVEGESYRVVDAVHHRHLHYVELTLIQVKNEG